MTDRSILRTVDNGSVYHKFSYELCLEYARTYKHGYMQLTCTIQRYNNFSYVTTDEH